MGAGGKKNGTSVGLVRAGAVNNHRVTRLEYIRGLYACMKSFFY